MSYFSLDNSDAIRVLRLIFPDIIILAVSTICFVIIRRSLLSSRRRQTNDLFTSTTTTMSNATTVPSSNSDSSTTETRRNRWPRLLSILRRIRLFIQFVLIGLAAIVYPSILNSIYFIFFLALALIWSLSVKFGRKFTFARVFLLFYTSAHLLTIYLYQFAFFQEALPPMSLWSK